MTRQASALIPTPWGEFQMTAFANNANEQMPNVLFAHPDLDINKVVYVRIHSECFTGDVFGSLRCDCGEQLHKSMEIIQEQKGVLIYLRQEGRGIGLIHKLKAYNLQDDGMDTVDANTHLGFKIDSRSYDAALEILNNLGIQKIKLITNNPKKVDFFDQTGINVIERIPIVMEEGVYNKNYIKTKRDKMGHWL